MRQGFAIFQKDVRHLWPRAAVMLGFTALMGVLDCIVPNANPLSALVEAIWVVGWIYLGASLIQEERIPGNEQYWLTRPYDWRSLLFAKALFFAVFAWLPVLAAETLSLAVNGVSPFLHPPLLLRTSLLFAGGAGLIGAALASVTESLVQFLWGFLALAGIELLAGADRGAWDTVAWVRTAAVAAVAVGAGLVVLFLQYASRRTNLSRGVLACAVLITAAVPFRDVWHSAWTLQSELGGRAVEPQAVRFSFDALRPSMKYADAPSFPKLGEEGLYLPVQLTGVPAGSAVLSKRIAATIDAGGTSWSSGWKASGGITSAQPALDVHLIRSDGPAWLYLNIDQGYYRQVQDTPARVHLSIAMILLDERTSAAIHVRGRTRNLPQDGVCEVRPGPSVSTSPAGVHSLIAACAWPGAGPERAYVRASSPTNGSSESLLIAGYRELLPNYGSVWRSRLTDVSVREEGLRLSLESWRAAAYFERELDISGVHLRQYLAPRATDPE